MRNGSVIKSTETIEDLLPRILRDFEEAARLNSMLNYINDNKDFRRHFDQTYEANGLNVVYHAILQAIIGALSRMYDPIDIEKRRGINRASLRHLMALLDDKKVISSYIESAADWTPELPHLSSTHRLVAARSICKARVRFKMLTQRDIGKNKLKQLKDYRDHHIGHSLFKTSKEINLLYGYLGEVFDQTGKIIEPLRLGINGQNWDFDDLKIVNERMATQFWTALELGMGERAKART